MLITAGIFILNACKKNEEEDKVQLDANVSQFNTDANNYKSESDQADNDINNSLSSIPAFGRVAQLPIKFYFTTSTDKLLVSRQVELVPVKLKLNSLPERIGVMPIQY